MSKESVEQKPQTPLATGSWWERLKPVWWLRGVVTAGALVGLADHLGFVRHDWLRIVHAIGARWNEWMGWITKWINIGLPFGWNTSSGEGSTLTLFGTLLAPAMLPAARALLKPPRKDYHLWIVAAFFAAALILAFQILSSIDMVPEPTGGYSPWYAIALTCLPALALLWTFQRRYLKALAIGLTFLLTLEIFYLVPAIQIALDPIIDTLEPAKPVSQ